MSLLQIAQAAALFSVGAFVLSLSVLILVGARNLARPGPAALKTPPEAAK